MFSLTITILLALAAFGVFYVSRAAAPQTALSLFGKPIAILAVVLTLVTGFLGAMFYAEPGYQYHVRTLFGAEGVVNGVGWYFDGWGRVTPWKKALSIQSAAGIETSAISPSDNDLASASLPLQDVVFLDQVHANVTASARFRLPEDPEKFLELVHEYRTPENLLSTSLIPAFGETLRANSMLMGAEEFYSGGQTQFINDFDTQLKHGTYIVHRREKLIDDPTSARKGTAQSALQTNQAPYGDEMRIMVTMEKELNSDGTPKLKAQKFLDFGIEVVEARVVNVDPSKTFKERMQAKQNAAAEMAIARQDKLKEEELKLAAVAKGQRIVAERQQELLKDQVEATTAADTVKAVTLTNAERIKQEATIQKEAAAIQLARDQLAAQSTKVLADADAYKKRTAIQANDALEQKLEAYVETQKYWADAFSKRQVPQTVMGATGSGDNDVTQFMQLMTMKAAKDLQLDATIDKKN